jgi:queuosine precursor transporter
MLVAAILIYAIALTLANLSITHFGPASIPVNAFFLIGLDLALRNWIALKINARQMLSLIAVAAAMSWALNPESGRIAAASFGAFSLSALVDWATFRTVRGAWLRRCLGGVTAGAAVDSLAFPLLAGFSLAYAPGLFAAKVAGGALWAWMLARATQRVAA